MPRLLRGIARTAVVAGTASAVGGRVRHRQDQKWAQQDAQAEPQPAYEPEQPSGPPAKDRLEQLKELGDLKAQGVLSEDEFAAEKAKILAG
jgi:Short C-terminal domain